MDEERDIIRNVAEAFREVRAIQEGKKKGTTLEEGFSLMEQWVAEVENENLKQAI